MEVGCSCIVPFYNEGDRVIRVLSELIRVKNIDEIICVDDGSTDNALKRIKKQYPQAILLKHQQNQGKSEAIATGLKKTKFSNIILIDADLRGLKKEEIITAIEIFIKQRDIDMLLLKRVNSILITKLVRSDVLHTGERLLRKKDLLKVLKLKPTGFEIEVAINRYMRVNNKNVKWFPISALSTFKVHKRGYIKGLISDLKMSLGMFFYFGLNNYWRQFFYAATIEEAKPQLVKF